MAPIAQLGLISLTFASVALAERHAHARGHRHLNRRQNRPYLTAPYGFTNGTSITAGPTGTGSLPDTTSTRTETLTSTITSTLTAPGEGPSGAAGEVPVGDAAASSPACGGTQYVTVTESVTVTASAPSPDNTDSSDDSGDDVESPATTSSPLPGPTPPVGYNGGAPSAPAPAAPSSEAPAAPAAPAPAPVNPASSPVAAPASPAPPAPSAPEAPAPAPSAPASYAAPAPPAPAPSAPSSYEAPAPPTQSTSSSTSSAAAAPTGYSSGGGSTGLKTKRGCLFQTGLNDCATLAAGGKLSWITNWADAPAGSTDGLVYIPQLWGNTLGAHDYTVGWKENCQTALDNGAPAIMGFNEPDVATQSNLDPKTAADVWQEQIVANFGQSGKILVSPGVASTQLNGNYEGLDWLDSFKKEGADWDATALHMYADCSRDDQLQYLQNVVEAAVERYPGKLVWVTEFGCQDPTVAADKQAAFMSSAIEYLEGHDKVQQYAAFKADLLAGNAVGNVYATMESNAPPS